MSDEDPILDGFPISQLRVVDLKDHLEKRGLDKKGNKKELADRLREYVLTNEAAEENVATNGSRKSPEKSPTKSTSSTSPEKENPVIAMYKARQQQMLAEAEAEKRKSLESKQSDEETVEAEKTTSVDETADTKEVTSDNGEIETKESKVRKQEERDVTPKPEEKQEESNKKGRRSTSRSRKVSETGNQSPTRRSSRQKKLAEVEEAPKKVLELDEEEEHEPSHPSVRAEPQNADAKAAQEVSKESLNTEDAVTTGGTESTQSNSAVGSPHVEKEELPPRSPSPEKRRRTPTPEIARPKITEKPSNLVKEEIVEKPQEADKGESKRRSKQEVQHGEEDLDYGDDYDEETEVHMGGGDTKRLIKENDVEEEEHRGDETMDVETSHIWLPESAGIKRVKEPSPCRYPASEYVHIRGLTRPFTQPQLNDLISKNGKIREFWIDKIKSNCIVQMSSVAEARHVRRALHNIVWPETNRKSLSVQFTTKEQFARYANGEPPITPVASKSDAHAAPISSSRHQSGEGAPSRTLTLPGGRQNLRITVETNVRENERLAVRHVERAREKEKEREKDKELREKNGTAKRRRSETPPFSRSSEIKRGKNEDQGRDERERERDRTGTRNRSRSRDQTRAGSRDRRNEPAEEPKPKALEELFKKTVAQPPIYYLPLTEEQAEKRAADKLANEKMRAEERERREKERREGATKRRSRSRSRSGDKRR